VAAQLGITPDGKVDLTEIGTLTVFIKAIIRHENGITTLFKRNYSERKINEVIAFCTTNINGDFCLICEPIYADYEHDAPETIRQIDRNNIIYDKICTSHYNNERYFLYRL